MTLMQQAYFRGLLNYLKVFYSTSGKEYASRGALSSGPYKSTSSRMAKAETYLHLLKRTLTRYPLELSDRLMFLTLRDLDATLTLPIAQWVMTDQTGINKGFRYSPILRALGLDWPGDGETMIGLYRLDNIQRCIVSVLQHNVPGDLAETGVWRGGASMFMRAVLKAYGDLTRKVWLADSFQGFPKPDEESYPADRSDSVWTFPQMAVPLETVKINFARYGLLDEQVHFLPGWFRDTLPTAPIDRLAVLRLDGGMYESTIVALQALYPKVSPGGFVIVDDYYYVRACQQAVEDFRSAEGITAPLCPIDGTGVYWQAKVASKG